MMTFYKLSSGSFRSCFHGHCDDDGRLFELAFRGEEVSAKPLRVSQLLGTQLCSFIWTDALVPLIHADIANAFRSSRITGWTTYPVEIFDEARGVIPAYSGLSIVGRCESLTFDRRESAVVYKEGSRKSFPYFRGLVFDEQSWDGSDLFLDRQGRLTVACTENVVKVLAAVRATNYSAALLSEVELLAVPEEIIKGA